MSTDKHSLNAQVDTPAYNEYRYVLKQEGKSVNSGTNSVIKEYVKDWKKRNKVQEITQEQIADALGKKDS